MISSVSRSSSARQSVRGNVIFGGGQGHIDPGGLRSRPDETTFARTPALMRNLIPALTHTALLRSWTGLEANTPDGLPVIGTSAGHDGFIHAYRFSGHGFATGRGVGGAHCPRANPD
ncbi:FAD-dependent oxidoreductase [Hoeflea alexandrii]|uniref:FAD-dependent oxidoreductase n=1 Tax=Hoeflea alexandrii TaxID=288436 RepID=UPI0022AEF528|nr:FAD-dependent oxidoreductase [Hoeflea alexandrii]MCZ4289298.1 FAD-dependent oxidoreductase [Hoeflea alexandrii]